MKKYDIERGKKKTSVFIEKKLMVQRKKNLNGMFSFKKKLFKKSFFHRIEVEKYVEIKNQKIKLYNRNENFFVFAETKKKKRFFVKIYFYLEQISHNSNNENNFYLFFFRSKENYEHIRKECVDRMISTLKNNKIEQNIKKKQPVTIVIIPNQTNFFQLIKTLIFLRKNKKIDKVFKEKGYYENNFFRIKMGRRIKPGDNRLNFSDGEEDFLNIRCSFKKKVFKFLSSNTYPDFIFMSPLSLRRLKNLSQRKFLNNSVGCFLDNFELITMQNCENLSMIMKIFYQKEKIKIKKFSKTGKVDVRLFQFFFICNYFSFFNFFSFFNPKSILIFIKNNSKKKKYFTFSKIKNKIFFRFFTHTGKDQTRQRLFVFQTKLCPFLFSKTEGGILIFCKKYGEYLLLRNHTLKFIRGGERGLLMLNEYLTQQEVGKRLAANLKQNGQTVLLTERYYFYFRNSLFRGNEILFYSFPANSEFFYELISSRGRWSISKKIYFLLHSSDIGL